MHVCEPQGSAPFVLSTLNNNVSGAIGAYEHIPRIQAQFA